VMVMPVISTMGTALSITVFLDEPVDKTTG
jgi:hypothetical protein